ncbi:ABC transporter permease [Halomarina halobia]|uniref:ABC transporter permease n=1 Tax=Halomarina halobia TaxID=3033386 RepID=A0ABD6AFS4_9EURY|nr:ABC transporter permease [Halomarina sp. PSR21]
MTFLWGFWPRVDFWMQPGFTLEAYRAFFETGRVDIYLRSLKLSVITVVGALGVGYPVAYYLARKLDENVAFPILFVFVLPFIISSIVRTFAWRFLLGRNGPINQILMASGVISRPIDQLLFSEGAVIIGLVTATIPFVIFPVWLSLRSISDSLLEASADLGAHPLTTFRRITLPLSFPGVFAASIFVFVTAFGSTAIPVLLGGGGFSTIGTAITSVLGVLNYPLAAAISTISIVTMLVLLGLWVYFFDLEEMITLGGGY